MLLNAERIKGLVADHYGILNRKSSLVKDLY